MYKTWISDRNSYRHRILFYKILSRPICIHLCHCQMNKINNELLSDFFCLQTCGGASKNFLWWRNNSIIQDVPQVRLTHKISIKHQTILNKNLPISGNLLDQKYQNCVSAARGVQFEREKIIMDRKTGGLSGKLPKMWDFVRSQIWQIFIITSTPTFFLPHFRRNIWVWPRLGAVVLNVKH